MKYLISIFLIIFVMCLSLTAQDVILTISGQIGGQKTSLDSIRIENLTDNSKVMFNDIPAQDQYLINLTTQSFIETTSIEKPDAQTQDWALLLNLPGELTLLNVNSKVLTTDVSVYSITGVKVYQQRLTNTSFISSLLFQLPGHAFYIIRLNSDLGTQTFKCIGSNNYGAINLRAVGNYAAFVTKTGQLTKASHFNPGDDIQIRVYKDGYQCKPKSKIVTVNESIVFWLLANVTYGSLTDIDGNTYKTVIIGGQEWMAENLATTRYADGVGIEYLMDNNAWRTQEPESKTYCWYNNDMASKDGYGYGALYTYATAVKGLPQVGTSQLQGICPDGWHLPSDEEWTILANYLADNGYNYDDSTDPRSEKIAQALVTEYDWSKNSIPGTPGYDRANNNRSGFSAIPSGHRDANSGLFFGAYDTVYWWSSTKLNSFVAHGRSISTDSAALIRDNDLMRSGRSVRCIKNTDHIFGSLSDIDGNTYKTIVIGQQEWMAENLATTRYADGTEILLVRNNIDGWIINADYEKIMCYYDNDPNNLGTYGALYNHIAATNEAPEFFIGHVQGACPDGWHLPENDEWEELASYLADNGHNWDESLGGGKDKIAKAMASSIAWENSTEPGAIGNMQHNNNSSGFSAHPFGFLDQDSDGREVNYMDYGKGCYFWSAGISKEKNNVYYSLNMDGSGLLQDHQEILDSDGLSIRCIKDYLEKHKVYDTDRNTYNAVKLGNQEWMAENLKVTQYEDGERINKIFLGNNWADLEDTDTDRAYCWYNNSETTFSKNSYGALYTYAAALNGLIYPNDVVVQVQGVCPILWHVPNNDDWSELANYLSQSGYNFDVSDHIGKGKIAKSMASTSGWNLSAVPGAVGNDPNKNNCTGFNANSGWGRRTDGEFFPVGENAVWWSSSNTDNGTSGYLWFLNYDEAGIDNYEAQKSNGAGVRCMRSFIMDIDSNIYATVKIGSQEWMAENLATTRYADGAVISNVSEDAEWEALDDNHTDKAYCWYDDNKLYKDHIGGYYTYASAVNGAVSKATGDIQGACPDGWQIPSEKDWMELVNYLSINGFNYDGSKEEGLSKIGKSLAGYYGWNYSSVYQEGMIGFDPELNNSSGFSGLPGGLRTPESSEYLAGGRFYSEGQKGRWWIADGQVFGLDSDGIGALITSYYPKSSGVNIRCIKHD